MGFIRQQSNGVCGNCRNHTITRCKHTNARVYSCLVFHTGSDKRPFGLEQRYCLSLHVRTHQRTVCVIVFQERNHRSCNRNDHLRGNIHKVNAILFDFQNLFPITSRNLMICKVSVFGQRFVCLCNNVIIFYISGHINNFVCYNASCLVYSPIRSFNKAIFVDSCECCQIRNQTDVRAFWRFNRAHSSVMAIMYVTNFKPCTVSGQTARTQCRQTTLMGQFCQRVVLIHELRQRRRTKEFFNCSRNWTDIDQTLWCDHVHILCLNVHPFPNDPFHSGETNPELVLQQFANRTDSTVAQVVDVVHCTNAFAEIQEIADGCIDIVQNNMLRNEFIQPLLYLFFYFFRCGGTFENFSQNRERNLFVDFIFADVKLYIRLQVNHAVTDDLNFPLYKPDGIFSGFGDIIFFTFYCQECSLYTSFLNLFCLFVSQGRSCIKQQFACHFIDDRTGQGMSSQTACNAQLLIILIPTEPAQIIPLCIEEQIVQVGQGAFHRRRFARTQLLINIQQCIFGILGAVLLQNGLPQTFIIPEHLIDFFVCSDTDCTDKGCQCNFPVLINPDIDDIVGIHFIFQPCTTVRNDSGLKQILTGAVFFRSVINARRTNQLRNDDTFCTIDDKRAAFGHEREVAHINFAFLDLAGFLIPEGRRHTQCGSISCILLLAFCNGILRLFINPVINKVQNQIAVVVCDRRNVPEDFL